jgi:coenzyme F420-reducing hydrogenase delta subunit
MGVDVERITFSWVSAAEGARWAEIVNTTTDKLRKLGPYTNYQNLVKSGIEEEL